MKKLLLILILGFFYSGTIAQNAKPIVVKVPDLGIYIQNQSFNIVAVTDNRPHRESIGNAGKGMGNKPVAIVFPKAADIYLLEYLQNNLPSYSDLMGITIKVDRLNLSERIMATKEIGFAELAIEVLTQKDGELFSMGKFEAKAEGTGLDVTTKHGERVYQVLINCLTQFAASDKQLTAYIPEAVQPSLLDFKPLLRKGLFRTYAEWVNTDAAPELTQKFDIKIIGEGSKLPRYQAMDAKTKKRIKGLFAFTDGESFYLNASQYTNSDYFVKSQLIGPYFLFQDVVTDPAMGVAFGAVGALASTKNNLYLFNPNSGNVKILDDKYMKELLIPYPELLSQWEASKGKKEDKAEIMALLNDAIMSTANR